MTDAFRDYSDWQQTLVALEPPLYPSEVHGGLCGLLCIKGSTEPLQWITTILPNLDENNLLHRDAFTMLRDLFNTTTQQLNDPTCDFHLLLPDDDTLLEDRVEALGDWCQGFLAAMSESGINNPDDLPQDVQEIIQDMNQIATAGYSYDLQDSEEAEEAYQELVEYIRVGTLLINEELQPIKSAPQSDYNLH